MKKVDKALKLSDNTEIVINLGEIIFKKIGYDYDDLTPLTEAEKTVLYIGMLEGEVNNGGFDQFFFNSTGDHCYEVLNACKIIGALKTADLVEQAIQHFPVLPVPKDLEIRREAMEDTSEATTDKWSSLDDAFYEYEDDIAALVVEYVKKTKDSFD